MTSKRNNCYKIILQETMLKDGSQAGKSLEFEFENHDNIFDIISKVQERNILGDKNQELEFSLGLKLFSEVMMKNNDNPLFEDLKPAFIQFMKKLKEVKPR